MGCGIKAYYDELEERIERDKLNKLSTHDPSKILDRLNNIRDCLQRFVQSNPSLTKFQHDKIDSALKSVDDLI